jgi:hypothetical protein
VEAVVDIAEVMTFETRTGTTRYVLRDSDGNEYTTFRESIGNEAKELEGKRARIEYHESQRGQYTNVYLDKVELASDGPGGGGGGTDPEGGAGGRGHQGGAGPVVTV